jgi:hypothetical protein
MAETSWASRDRPVKGHLAIASGRKRYDVEVSFPPTPLGERIILGITGESELGPNEDDDI